WVIIMVDADIDDDQTFALFSGYSLTATDGLNKVEIDATDGPVEYFNLQGIRMQGKPAPGIYIRRQGNRTEKVFVK
ncbi:MAG: hypothetical protein K2L99_07930, partial [Muribaculaceae bacterium]|nr:hypothetical protein [Muribaculaceae bacterium]